MVEWFANHYMDFGAKLEFVTNKSQEGSQFVRGFGGIGGLLRWKVDFVAAEDPTADIDDFFCAWAAPELAGVARGFGCVSSPPFRARRCALHSLSVCPRVALGRSTSVLGA